MAGVSKSDLVDQIAVKLNYPKTKIAGIVDEVFKTIEANLADGKDVVIKGFGKWSLRKIEAKTGHKDPSGRIVDIPAYRRVSFKAGDPLKAAIR